MADFEKPPQLGNADLVHLYRGELAHADAWRGRLDQTTNWALTTTAAVISLAFSHPESRHASLLVGVWMVVSFLLIEARRYRYYDIWFRRVRLLEDGFWASTLRGEPVDPDAIRELALELSRPQIRLSLFAAVAVRLNRAYGPILLVLMMSWFVKVYSHPVAATTFGEFVEHAHVGAIPGVFVFAVVSFLSALLIVFSIAAMIARPPMGELRVRPRVRRAAIWQMVSRPYGVQSVRRRPKPPTRGRPIET